MSVTFSCPQRTEIHAQFTGRGSVNNGFPSTIVFLTEVSSLGGWLEAHLMILKRRRDAQVSYLFEMLLIVMQTMMIGARA
jgi:hypothetical protein